MRMLQIDNLIAQPGQKVDGFITIVGESEPTIPVTLICGAEEGETALIQGGLHNAEYVGIQAAMELAAEIDPKDVKGNIIEDMCRDANHWQQMNPNGYDV